MKGIFMISGNYSFREGRKTKRKSTTCQKASINVFDKVQLPAQSLLGNHTEVYTSA